MTDEVIYSVKQIDGDVHTFTVNRAYYDEDDKLSLEGSKGLLGLNPDYICLIGKGRDFMIARSEIEDILFFDKGEKKRGLFLITKDESVYEIQNGGNLPLLEALHHTMHNLYVEKDFICRTGVYDPQSNN